MSEETELLYPAVPYAETLSNGSSVTITRVDEENSYVVFDTGCGTHRACVADISVSPIDQAVIKTAIEAAKGLLP